MAQRADNYSLSGGVCISLDVHVIILEIVVYSNYVFSFEKVRTCVLVSIEKSNNPYS